MTTEMSKEEIALQQMKDKVTDEGHVNVDALMVVMMGQEQVLGECIGTTIEGQLEITLKNPKRFLRLQQVQPGNFRIDFLIIDLDHMSSGKATFFPSGFYYLKDMDTLSQLRMLLLYATYLENKKVARAAQAGIKLAGPGDVQGLGADVRPIR